MKQLRLLIRLVLNLFGLVDKKTIWIDGGFGSQIIGYMQYVTSSHTNQKVKCDISFFKKLKSDSDFTDNLTFREWQLDYFGIDLGSFKDHKSKFRLRPDTKAQGLILEKFLSNFKKNIEWQKIFPLKNETIKLLKNNYQINEQKYTAIHIRKGDFLKFSSLKINDSQVFNFVKSIKHILNDKIYFISDDLFNQNYINEIKKICNDSHVEFIGGGNEFEIHALMRESDILITSNSMFSLSAALLQKAEGVSIMPKYFYGVDFKEYNKAVGTLSNWVVLAK